ncbi:MAG: alginate biosynthesis protein AlgM [Thalassobium sp.]|nr:MAG: alginate biosynthesis protein AlgM [Thalassobium sp.]
MSQEVVAVVEQGEGGIWVEATQRSACGSCNARSGCGQHSLSKLGRPMRLWIPTDRNYQVGDQVILSLPQGGLALSALVLYGLPLVGLIAGAILGQRLGTDLLSALVGIAGLGIGFVVAKTIRTVHKTMASSNC